MMFGAVLLASSDASVAEVVARVGYASDTALSRTFKCKVGVAPGRSGGSCVGQAARRHGPPAGTVFLVRRTMFGAAAWSIAGACPRGRTR